MIPGSAPRRVGHGGLPFGDRLDPPTVVLRPPNRYCRTPLAGESRAQLISSAISQQAGFIRRTGIQPLFVRQSNELCSGLAAKGMPTRVIKLTEKTEWPQY